MIEIRNRQGKVLRTVEGETLFNANLSGAGLSGANLNYAHLSDANLNGADLSNADLSHAYLINADLKNADLSYANLSYANLSNADLNNVDLTHTDLSYAYLRRVKNLSSLVAAKLTIVPTTGSFRAWKKCQGGVIVELLIPEDAKRSNSTTRKCRAEYADVLKVIGATEGKSWFNPSFIYGVGKRVVADRWEEDRWVECGGGIHFFLTKEEAEASQE